MDIDTVDNTGGMVVLIGGSHLLADHVGGTNSGVPLESAVSRLKDGCLGA